jgi:hypothetical protein
MKYDRLLNKAIRPNESRIESYIGSRLKLWRDIHQYLADRYDFAPELVFFTKKYGWTIRYRRSGKTLCYFFPEDDAFSILIVLGAKESEKVALIKDKLNQKAIDVFENTEQLRDGKWMWMRILEKSDLESLKLFIGAKKKPKDISQ